MDRTASIVADSDRAVQTTLYTAETILWLRKLKPGVAALNPQFRDVRFWWIEQAISRMLQLRVFSAS